ncbi:MAG: hypothetical protein WHU10_05615 [Fimbriimonadales bacterium]
MEAVSRRYPDRDDYDDLSSFAPIEAHPHPEGPVGQPPRQGSWHAAVVEVREEPKVRFRVSWILNWLLLAGALFALILGAMAQSSAGAPDETLGLWYLGIAVLVVAAMLRLLAQLGNGTLAPAHVAELAHARGLQKALPVRVRILVDGKAVGEDDGLVRFEHGLLSFHGLQCDFVLGSQDIRLVSSCGQLGDFLADAERSPRISLNHPGAKLEVCFQPWSRLTPEDPRDCVYRFAHELRRFLHAWRPGAGERVWPPVVPKPEASCNGVTLHLRPTGA